MRRSFLVLHVAWIVTLGLGGGCLMFAVEWTADGGHPSLGDMLFAAVSAVTCTGLVTHRANDANAVTVLIWYVLAALGSPVVTAIIICWRKQMHFESRRAKLTGANCNALLQPLDDRIEQQRKLIAIFAAYALFSYAAGAMVLARVMCLSEAIGRSVGAFSNSGWLGDTPQALKDDLPSLVVTALMVPMGCTMFPSGIRIALRVAALFESPQRRRRATPEALLVSEEPSGVADYGATRSVAVHARSTSREPVPVTARAMLDSRDPGTDVHPMLFTGTESHFIAIVWAATVVGTFLIVLPVSGSASLAFAQAAALRFSGITFVDFNALSSARLCLVALVLYLPVYIVFQDRTRRLWDCWVERCSPVASTLSSRALWLAGCAIAIVAFDEAAIRLHKAPTSRDVDSGVVFNVFFEVMSAYATTGVTLAPPNANGASLCASFSGPSQLIIALVMLAGRHRNMDLDIPY